MSNFHKLTIVLGLTFLLYSCCANLYRYNYINLEIVNVENSGKEPVESLSNNFRAKAYGFRVKVKHKTVDKNGLGYHRSNKCRELISLRSPLDSINIFTKNNFDNFHLAGSNVSDYFVFRFSDSTSQNYISKENLINYLNKNNIDERRDETISFDFFLTKTPVLDSACQFKIVFVFQDSTLIGLTDTLILK